MAQTIPMASHEVRWFFEGKADQHKPLKAWFETVAPIPIPKNSGVGPPVWKGRLDDQPDIYLLVPGSDDMGIKWREGELQIKGRVSSLGTQVFCGRHQGVVECWVKWSYKNVPASYQRLFAAEKELVTASVRKTRALRKVRLDTLNGKAEEVDAKTMIDRGLGFELTDLEVAGKAYCSLAFEAFPNDSGMDAAFTQAVEAFLDGLKELDLTVAHSRSYPAWLGSVTTTKQG